MVLLSISDHADNRVFKYEAGLASRIGIKIVGGNIVTLDTTINCYFAMFEGKEAWAVADEYEEGVKRATIRLAFEARWPIRSVATTTNDGEAITKQMMICFQIKKSFRWWLQQNQRLHQLGRSCSGSDGILKSKEPCFPLKDPSWVFSWWINVDVELGPKRKAGECWRIAVFDYEYWKTLEVPWNLRESTDQI